LSHDADAFCTTISEQERHANLDILGTNQKTEEARPGLVGAEKLASENSFDDGSLTDTRDVDCVLESLLYSLDAWVLDDNNCCLLNARIFYVNLAYNQTSFVSSHLEKYTSQCLIVIGDEHHSTPQNWQFVGHRKADTCTLIRLYTLARKLVAMN
jgi:hypothetical protein